jgi:hypothetical protein
MPERSKESIIIFAAAEPAATRDVTRRGPMGASRLLGAKGVEIAVSTMQENISRFLDGLDAIIGESPVEIGEWRLDEIEIHTQIDGKGNIGISGILGAELAAQGGIKFVLRKKV